MHRSDILERKRQQIKSEGVGQFFQLKFYDFFFKSFIIPNVFCSSFVFLSVILSFSLTIF